MIHRPLAAALAMLVAVPATIEIASAAQPAAAQPAAKPTPAAKSGHAHTGPRGPRSAKSLDCSKQADAKNLHGAARTSFMRGCNKG